VGPLGRQTEAALVVVLLGAGCGPSTKDIETAQIHYDLGVSAMQNAHDPQAALKELEIAVKANPDYAEAHNVMGLVYQLMLHRPEDAVIQYQAALRIDPKFSEAANNLGTTYIELGRYSEARKMFERVLSDDLYHTPYIAQGNLGWALYKSGDIPGGIAHLKTSIQLNPGYCQGYRSLGTLYYEIGKLEDAEKQFTLFQSQCPQVCESGYRLGLTLLKENQQERAKAQFATCAACKEPDLAAECSHLLKLMQ
jgi:type IV pilus biogenesis/stability protein PilW